MHGSTAIAGLPRTGKISTTTRSPSCASPLSVSCSENFVIPHEVSGRTLRHRAVEVLKVTDDNLNCLVLDEVELLSPGEYLQLAPDFIATQNPKDFPEGGLPHIGSRFYSITMSSLSDFEAQLAKDGLFDPNSVKSAREFDLRAIAMRKGQAAFRQMLMDAYGGRCAVTGTDVGHAIEAAQICPYNGLDTNVVQNGILLRADWHVLFDLG
jgi:hypothetical protein